MRDIQCLSDAYSGEKRNTITIEDVRSMPEFADYTEEQATELIQAVVLFADIIYDLWCHNKDGNIPPVNFSQEIHKLA